MFEEIKGRMSSRNDCYLSVQSKNINTAVYRNFILPVVLYGCETWCLILREIIGWGCSRIGCWGRYSGLRGMRKQETVANCTIRKFRNLYMQASGSGRLKLAGHMALWERGEVHTEFLWGNPKKGDRLEDLCIGGSIILKWIVNIMWKHGLD